MYCSRYTRVMSYRKRRLVAVLAGLIISLALLVANPESWETAIVPQSNGQGSSYPESKNTYVLAQLEKLQVKGRAPKTGYSREQFGGEWQNNGGCDTRNIILHRDLENDVVDENCKVLKGLLHDPYTGKTIQFSRGATTSDDVQIDHVVAVSNAWQTGAQQLNYEKRVAFYNDPLNLLAVDGQANQQKGDGDAATWLPKNKAFRCQYVNRQILVKTKYKLWLTAAEKSAMRGVLYTC